jgi:hypothetical protein
VLVKAAPSGLGRVLGAAALIGALAELGGTKLGRPNLTAIFWPQGIAFSDRDLLHLIESDGVAGWLCSEDDSVKAS